MYPPIVMSGYAEVVAEMTVLNAENTVEVRPPVDGPEAFLSGGPMGDKYKFAQLHFHWGSTDAVGSEHSIDGNFYFMEAHFVHYNHKYQSFEEGRKEADGLAVAAIFLRAKSNDDLENLPTLAGVMNIQPSTKTIGRIADLFPEIFEWLKGGCFCCRPYFTYKGSLTTPPFTENVIWLVYSTPIEISKSRIDLFWQLRISEGCEKVSNCRKIQPLGERQVFMVRGDENEDLPKFGVEKSFVLNGSMNEGGSGIDSSAYKPSRCNCELRYRLDKSTNYHRSSDKFKYEFNTDGSRLKDYQRHMSYFI